MGGVGGILYATKSSFTSFSAGLGPSTNNRAELMAVKILLKLAISKGIECIQIYGDSKLVVDWLYKIRPPRNIILQPIYEDEEVASLIDRFNMISFCHIYRKLNSEADRLSKEGFDLEEGFWQTLSYDGDSMSILEMITFPV